MEKNDLFVFKCVDLFMDFVKILDVNEIGFFKEENRKLINFKSLDFDFIG